MEKWQRIAKAEGRVCPECKRPVSKKQWREMNKSNPIAHCNTCKLAHWEVPLHGAGGSSYRDNQDRDGLEYLRKGYGE